MQHQSLAKTPFPDILNGGPVYLVDNYMIFFQEGKISFTEWPIKLSL
jgi:hypothetical protein